MILHPGRRRLEAYGDATLAGDAARDIAAHLVRCPRCRARVGGLRALGHAARALSAPPPAEDLFDRVLARRGAGERIILPAAGAAAAPAAAPRNGRRRVGGWRPAAWEVRGAVAAAALVLLLLATRGEELGARTSDLQLTPSQPTVGARVEARYRPAAALAGEPRLVLRARLRSPADEAYEAGTAIPRVLAVLEPGADGIYRGSFSLPEEIVYALLVVEDEAARVVDTNLRRGWELLVHDRSGTPLEDALAQRSHDMMGRNWELAYETARERAARYPGLGAWRQLRFYESATFGTEDLDDRMAVHRQRFRALHERLSAQPSLSGDTAGAMMWFAYGVQDSGAIRYWEERFEREHPAHPLAVQNRALRRISTPHFHDPETALRLLEDLWGEVGYRHENQFHVALQHARRAGDVEALRRWQLRLIDAFPRSSGMVGAEFVRFPELREEGQALLRERIAELEANAAERRRLFRTLEEQQHANRAEQRRYFAALGRALAEQGHTAAALDTLRLATAEGWDVALLRDVAAVRIAAGDTAGAVELWARVAVDPTTSSEWGDSVRSRAPGADWTALLRRARHDMHSRVLAGAVTRSLPRQLPVLDGSGRRRNLHDYFDGQPGAVVFWSRDCGPALDALPEILRVAARLREEGTPFVLLVDAAPTPALRAYFEREGVDMPIAYDSRGAAMRALVAFGTPSYFVLDGEGRVRFEEAQLGDLPRLVATLYAQRALATGASR